MVSKKYWIAQLVAASLLFPLASVAQPSNTGEINGYSIAKLFSLVESPVCPPATYRPLYGTCRSPACGQEDINDGTPFDFNDEATAPCKQHSQAACADRIPRAFPGWIMKTCDFSCTVKNFKAVTNWKGTRAQRVDRQCQTDACGVVGQEIATRHPCRDISHEPDRMAIVEAMNTGNDVDRAAGLLVETIRQIPGITLSVRKIIEESAARPAATAVILSRRLDRIRLVLARKGASATEEDVRLAAAEPSVVLGVRTQTLRANLFIKKPTPQEARMQRPAPTTSRFVGQGYLPASPKLHMGYNSTTGEVRGSCVKVPSPTSSTPPVKRVTFSLTTHDSYESLAESLFGSISVSVLGSGSASASFSRALKSTAQAVHIVVDVVVTVSDFTSEKPVVEVLDIWAGRLKQGGGKEAFFTACGDRFVVSETRGARYTAVLTAQATTREERDSLSLAIKGGVQGSWNAAAEFQKSVEKLSRATSLRVTTFIEGFPGDQVPTTADGIVEYAKNFAEKVDAQKSVVLDVRGTDYGTLQNTGGLDPFLSAEQTYDLSRSDRALRGIQAKLSEITYIRENPERYDWQGMTQKDLDDAQAFVETDQRTLVRNASACYTQAKCDFKLPTNYLTVKLPLAKPKRMFAGGCGSDDGRFFNSNGGCMDASTFTLWSSVLEQAHTFDDAKRACEALAENQTARGFWALPSMFDFQGFIAGKVAYGAHKNGAELYDYFWVHDGTPERRPIWIFGHDGSVVRSPETALKLRVICLR